MEVLDFGENCKECWTYFQKRTSLPYPTSKMSDVLCPLRSSLHVPAPCKGLLAEDTGFWGVDGEPGKSCIQLGLGTPGGRKTSKFGAQGQR